MSASLRSRLCLVSLLLIGARVPPAPGQVATPDGVRPFAPGIRVDWPNLTVELDAEVTFREGPIELFACSPKTKEHESILVVPAKPSRIYQALGLVGLNPGSPPRWHELNQRWEPATGDNLELRVRYVMDSTALVASSQAWVAYAQGAKSSGTPTLSWVFAGGKTLSDGRFAADVEGTVAAVVDFDTSLIALSASHTSDNEELWLVANAADIPPRGTKCVLLIRAAHHPIVQVSMLPDGTLRQEGRLISLDELAERLRTPPTESRPAELRLCQEAGTSDETRESVLADAKKRGFAGTIQVQRPPCRSSAATGPLKHGGD